MTDLMLHLQKQWFDKIKSGEKTEEYRETTEYWKRRILGKTFDRIVLVRGNYGNEKYPKNVMIFPWRGYEIKIIKSWETQGVVEVFAIKLDGDAI
jgi:hypothetical protein